MKNAKDIGLVALILTGLPLAGVWTVGHDLSSYLEFPPRTRYAQHAAFSWPVFAGLAVVISVVMLPFLIRICAANRPAALSMGASWTVRRNHNPKRLPWWGWLSLALGLLCWRLAWTRQAWFEPMQRYTFTPQWLCYIAAVNALSWRRTGRCLLTHHTKFLLKLFPLSAAFWWFFEYLNRFVQNWFYTCGTELSPAQYFIAATLSFSTVLPSVLSTEEWLASHPRCTAGLENFIPIRFRLPKLAAAVATTASGSGLFFIGRFPDQLFPLLWTAPLLLLIALRTTANRPPIFPEIKTGDWRRVYRFCLAALICGFFWELWNGLSLAKWVYSIPYVERFHLFEMPILGYAGYLPFGLECALIAAMVRKNKNDKFGPTKTDLSHFPNHPTTPNR